MKHRLNGLGTVMFAFAASLFFFSNKCTAKKPMPSVSVGSFNKIYDPSDGEEESWYINDHTIIRGNDQRWHMFGITHTEPANPDNEVNFAHATAIDLARGPWHKQSFALTASPEAGESHLWAPYIIKTKSLYYMYYGAGDTLDEHSRSRIHLATSSDLTHWTRHVANPMVVDGFDARDPYVLRISGQWVMYYTATTTPTGGNHVVAFRTSQDLIHWKKAKGSSGFAFIHPGVGTWGGATESPFVINRAGTYFLFIGPKGAYGPGPDGYSSTAVYASADPLHFAAKDYLTSIAAHALEIIKDDDGQLYVSHAGWGQGGLYLAQLFFNPF